MKVGVTIAIGVCAPLILLLTAIGPALAYSGTWVDVTHDWGPCSGYNHYSFSKNNLGPGKFNGYSQDQANGDVLCNPDTTEHEVNAGVFSNGTYTATSTGYLTVKATFSGYVYIWAVQNGCDHGTGHGFFKLGVGVLDTSTGINQSYTKTAYTDSQSCGSLGNDTNVSTTLVSNLMSLTSGHIYKKYAFIDEQTGSIEYYQGSNAQALVGFENVCWTVGTGDTCSEVIQLHSITIT
ncbi:MAG: hypothetical protein ACLQD8_06940 [Thermoplasmata archaeon]